MTLFEEVFEGLLSKNGSTSSLEVKNELRGLGYTVFQTEVSIDCQVYAKSKGYVFTDNGQYITYTKPKPVIRIDNSKRLTLTALADMLTEGAVIEQIRFYKKDGTTGTYDNVKILGFNSLGFKLFLGEDNQTRSFDPRKLVYIVLNKTMYLTNQVN